MGLNQPLLINILGHAAGALIFAIFLVLLYSGRGWSGMRGRYLSGLAAGLSLAWNLGSLVVLAWPGLPAPVMDLVVAISFSVLSLLPAVLLHVSLEDRWPALVAAGYAAERGGGGHALLGDSRAMARRSIRPRCCSSPSVSWY